MQPYELGQLRGRDVERLSGRGQGPLVGLQVVERFGEKGWEIVVLGVDVEFPFRGAGLPCGRGAGHGRNVRSELNGEIDPQPEPGDLEVLMLTATFGGPGFDAGWPMANHNGRFDFIAVLPSGALSPCPAHVAIRLQRFRIAAGGVIHESATSAVGGNSRVDCRSSARFRAPADRGLATMGLCRFSAFRLLKASESPFCPIGHPLEWIQITDQIVR